MILLLGLYSQCSFAQWAKLNSGTEEELNSIFFSDENIGYTCGSNGHVGKTIDGGKNWTDVSLSKPFKLHDLYFLDSLRGYVVGLNALIYKTIDGGVNWTEDKPISGETEIKSIAFKDTSYGVAVGEEGKIYVYENGIWTKQSLSNRVNLNDVAINDNGFAIIAADSGKIYRKKQVDPLFDLYPGYSSTTPFTSVQFIEDIIYITGGWFDDSLKRFTWHFLESKDSGEVFTKNSTMDLEAMNKTHFISLDKAYYLGKSTGFYASDDKFKSNYRLLPGTNNTLNNFFFVNQDVVFACGVAGTIVKTSHSPGWNTSNEELEMNLGFYPNPAKKYILFNSPKVQHLSLYNSHGLLVMEQTIIDSKVDVSLLPKGMYVSVIRYQGDQVNMGKLILE